MDNYKEQKVSWVSKIWAEKLIISIVILCGVSGGIITSFCIPISWLWLLFSFLTSCIIFFCFCIVLLCISPFIPDEQEQQDWATNIGKDKPINLTIDNYCIYCGLENITKALFCLHCGTELEGG